MRACIICPLDNITVTLFFHDVVYWVSGVLLLNALFVTAEQHEGELLYACVTTLVASP